MDKHYGWQEGRAAQHTPGRMQNGQRWNERYRDDDRDVRGRGNEYGWDDDNRYGNRERFSSGADLDREDPNWNGPEDWSGSQRPGQWSQRTGGDLWRGSQSEYGRGREFGGQGGNRWRESGNYGRNPFGRYGGGEFGFNRGQGGQGYQSGSNQFGGSQSGWNRSESDQGFSGGHYGGFANEGYPDQASYGRGFTGQGSGEGFGGSGNWGGNRGFSSGYGSPGQGDFQSSQRSGGQRGQNYGQTFGQGYAGQGYGQGRGFSGRGPKGYQRSDERIKEQVSDRLMDDDDIDASEITIDVRNAEVTLTGTVGSRQEKRAAEDAAEQTPGVREVQNHLRVQSQESWGPRGGQSASGQSASSSQTGSIGGKQDSFSKSQESSSGQSRSKSTERE